MTVTLSFLGGAGTVTGSKYLLEQDGHRILIDCGLFQGLKVLRLKNWAKFPVDPASIGAVVLTHAHIDHSGYLPLLVRNGFRGPVFCTAATKDLCGVLLPDSAHLQESDAAFANRHGFSKHKPAMPLYDAEDAERALKQLRAVAFDEGHKLVAGASVTFRRAGHILGAASLELHWNGTRIVFSGDLGRYDDPLMQNPAEIASTDWLVVESTYGDRLHDGTDVGERLAETIARTIARGGTVIVPAFAVGRAQLVLYYLHKLRETGRIPASVPVFLDSPMSIDASDIFRAHANDHKLGAAECHAVCATAAYVREAEQSKALTANPLPKIIVSASGMATGGRVLHHLKRYAPDTRSTILFTGFQAPGTRGAAMTEGAQAIKIHGEYIPVRAEVSNLNMLSAHADQREIMRWLSCFKSPPLRTFITHGEPAASDALRKRIEEDLGWTCVVPEQREKVELL